MTSSGSAGVRQARRRLSRHGASALEALLLPAVLFPIGLFLLRDDARFAWLGDVRVYPWELWMIAVCRYPCSAWSDRIWSAGPSAAGSRPKSRSRRRTGLPGGTRC